MDEKEAEARPIMGTIFLVAARCNKMNNVTLYFKVAGVTYLAKFVVVTESVANCC